MGGSIFFPDFLARLLPSRLRRELFLVLDIGTFSVKALVAEIEKGGKSVRVLAVSSRQHVGSDINADGTFNIDGITNTTRAVINELCRIIGPKTKAVKNTMLGIGGGFVFGKTLTQTYIRENSLEEIDERELANIIQKIQQRNYEQIRRDFRRDTGRSELEVHITSSAVLEIKIDGYQIINPAGFKGKEISCAIFNAYIPKSYYALFEKLISALNLNLLQIASEPYAVFYSFLQNEPFIGDFILIDIGGSVTEIALARKGKLEDVRSMSLGGSSFTNSIAERLKIGFWEAENIKRKFAKGEVSGRVAKLIEEIVLRDIELLLNGLELVLTDMSQISLLPANIYLYGGGSTLPLFHKVLAKKDWRKSLSFFSRPVIASLPFPAIPHPIKNAGEPASPNRGELHWLVALSIADSYAKYGQRDDELAKTMRRSLRLIQG